ncbi:MAG: MFS transporter [Roseiflexaceae bacterium]|nr:MFS transporter [Roseiflexaceae bacterium]
MAEASIESIKQFEHEVAQHVRWNFAVNILDVSFITFGLSLISRETVMPLLISKLTDSTIAIGLFSAIYTLGISLPQLIGAGMTEALPRKKPLVMLIGAVGERLPYLFAGLAVLLFAQTMPLLALIAILLMFGLSGASAGFATPAWFDMIAKVIPVQRRGLFTGLSHGLGALMGVAGAAVIGIVLERATYPQNFALLFGIAFVAMIISWVGLALNREPASISVRAPTSLKRYFQALPAILRGDRNFARYLIAMVVVRAGTMAGGFLIVYGVQRFQLGGAEIGLLTGVLIGCQAILNPLWGTLGDRRGHKMVLVGGAIALALATLVAFVMPSWPWLVVAFLLIGAFISADSASFLTILPEFCRDEDRPTYIGLTNTLMAPVAALAPLIGGWIAAQFGFPTMFACASIFAIIGAILLWRWVREPRGQASIGVAPILREQPVE